MDGEEFRGFLQRMATSRQVFGSERCCDNCVNRETCFPAVPDVVEGVPSNFRLRMDWDVRRLRIHMKRIYGQLCGNFHSTDPVIERHFHKPEPGWDREENG